MHGTDCRRSCSVPRTAIHAASTVRDDVATRIVEIEIGTRMIRNNFCLAGGRNHTFRRRRCESSRDSL